MAIARHIARKHDLLGKTPEEFATADMVEGVIADWRQKWTAISYNPNFESAKADYISQVSGRVEPLERFLKGKKWFAGENLTYADFLAFELILQNLTLAPALLDGCPNLVGFLKNFRELEGISETEKKFEGYLVNDPLGSFNATIKAPEN